MTTPSTPQSTKKIDGVDGLCWKCQATGEIPTPTQPQENTKNE